MSKTSSEQAWSSKLGFILAAIGSAVGLGSIWKFPYEVGENGGGAFLLFYVLGLLIVVAPLLVAEFVIGRRGRGDAASSVAMLALEAGCSPRWSWIGYIWIFTGFLILSYYAVIGGLTVAYFIRAISGSFAAAKGDESQAIFDALVSSPLSVAAYQAFFVGITAIVVARGIGGGVESACKVLVPILAVLMVMLSLYAAVEGDLGAALEFLFVPHLEELNPRNALEALGLGFFSIGVGLGIMVTYAAYAGRDFNLTSVTVVTLVGDTAISLLAGIAIFPMVFSHGLDPAEGASLMFVTLPIVFGDIPFGGLVGAAFFLCLFAAALASAMSMLELVVAPAVRWSGRSRGGVSLLLGLLCWVAGIPTVLSFNLWSDMRPLAWLPAFASTNIYGLVDGLASNLLLPLGGLTLSIFAGWRLRSDAFAEELGWLAAPVAALVILLRWIVPLAVVAFVVAGHLLR